MPSRYRDASAQEVREWARANGWDVGERGRFSSEIVSAFNQDNKPNYIRYTGNSGGTAPAANSRQSSSQGNSRPRNTNQAPARPASRPAASNTPARRAPTQNTQAAAPAPARDVPTPRPVPQEQPDENRAVVVRNGDEAAAMVQDVIAALTSASNVGQGEGEPFLLHVEGWRLSYAAAS